jgi:hypothetical protein
MRRFLAAALAIALVAPGCATMSSGPKAQVAAGVKTSPSGRDVVVDYARSLSAGTRVRLTTVDRVSVRGTLLKSTDTALFVQPRGRVAEPIVEIAMDRVASIEREKQGNNIGRAVAIGGAAGAGAALGVFYLLVLAYTD